MTTSKHKELLRVTGISKRFGATQALSNVSLDIRAGEVHALTGENGAGKSTLMKIISGIYQPDEGTILINGVPTVMASPTDAMTAGIAIIHQELNTIPEMTVAENLAIGAEPVTKLHLLDRRRMNRDAVEKLQRVGATIDPQTPIGRLSVGMQQMVEIARAVSEKANILVLDEPTASLSKAESERLFQLINKMRDDGMGLIYISHRMDEVWELSDRVTVFRDGKLVGTCNMHATGKDVVKPNHIISMMVGRDLEDLYIREARSIGDVRLQIDNLSGAGGIGPVTFDIRAGEIVGMAGLIGAGRTEVARLIYGADRATAGTITLDGKPIKTSNPHQGVASGIGLLPESRKEQALFLDMAVRDNIAISTLEEYGVFGVLNARMIARSVANIIEKLRVRTASQQTESRFLSGGNQQKLVLGRLLLQKPGLLILDEPTRGVDIGAKSEIYRIINEIAKSGTSVLLISSDLPEVLGMSDRILVMRDGKIAGELTAKTATENSVMEHATGVYVET